ncbi:MAG: hypothetical protein LBC94_01990 [Desulfovibrio sp.]|jgi:hypothetical protein|nr:hypothetical protein [Desulfovibrio sp.]
MKLARFLTIVTLCLACLIACTGKYQDIPADPDDRSKTPAPGVVLRHKVSIDFLKQKNPFTFDGLLQLGGAPHAPLLRAVGLGAMGLTLFDMRMTQKTVTVAAIHPSLWRIPHFRQQIALCLAGVYNTLFDSPAFAFDKTKNGHGETRLSDERPWPQNMEFKHNGPDYIVTMKLVGIQKHDPEARH